MTNYAVPTHIEDIQSLRLLKVAEVAKITQLSSSQIYTLIQEGALTAVRFGHAVRIRPQDLEQYIQENITNQENRFGLQP